MKRNLFLSSLILLIFVSCNLVKSQNSEVFKSVEKGIYLSGGKLYQYDFTKKETKYLAISKDSILNFALSPTRKYIAFEKSFKYFNTAVNTNSIDSMISSTAVVVYDLELNKNVKEILPHQSETINIDRWVNNDELLCTSGYAFAVMGWYSYKINNNVKLLNYGKKTDELRSTLFTKDFRMKFSVDSLGNMLMFDQKFKKDKIITRTANNVYDIEISNNLKYLTWFEIVDAYNTVTKQTSTNDVIYLKNISNDSLVKIYDEAASGKGENKCMKFSPNDSVLSIELGRRLESLNDTSMAVESLQRIKLINIFTKHSKTVEGFDASWINSGQLLYSKSDGLYLYDLKTDKSSLFIKQAVNFEPFKYGQ